jgi:hypothetical protein
MPTYPVRRGAGYFAGMDLPFFVNVEQVKERARALGFREVLVTPRTEARFAFEVHKVPGYRDNWDTAFFGIYDGNATTLDLPGAPSWLFEVRQQLPPVGKQVVAEVVVPRPKGSPAPARPSPGGVLALTLAGGVAVWIFFATIRPVRRRGF